MKTNKRSSTTIKYFSLVVTVMMMMMTWYSRLTGCMSFFLWNSWQNAQPNNIVALFLTSPSSYRNFVFRCRVLGLWPVNWWEFWIIIYFLMFVMTINSLSSPAHLSPFLGSWDVWLWLLYEMIGVNLLSLNRHGTSQLLIIIIIIIIVVLPNIWYLISETPHMSAQKRPLLTPSLKIDNKEFWKFLHYQLAISFDINNFQICMQIIMIGSITGNGKLLQIEKECHSIIMIERFFWSWLFC